MGEGRIMLRHRTRVLQSVAANAYGGVTPPAVARLNHANAGRTSADASAATRTWRQRPSGPNTPPCGGTHGRGRKVARGWLRTTLKVQIEARPELWLSSRRKHSIRFAETRLMHFACMRGTRPAALTGRQHAAWAGWAPSSPK